MTWLSTWPTPTGSAHAVEVVRTGRARVATCFQNTQPEECM